MTARACKAARRVRIASHCEFATHRRRRLTRAEETFHDENRELIFAWATLDAGRWSILDAGLQPLRIAIFMTPIVLAYYAWKHLQ